VFYLWCDVIVMMKKKKEEEREKREREKEGVGEDGEKREEERGRMIAHGFYKPISQLPHLVLPRSFSRFFVSA
jgi:hypothetical protein